MRNANGQGSVSRMNGNRRNKWRVLAPAQLVWSDKKGDYIYKQITIGYCKTKTEAFSLLYKYTNNPELFSNTMTVKELWQIYYNEKEKVSSDLILNHLKRTEHFLTPYLNFNFKKLTNTQIQDLFNKSTYSKKTLSVIKAYLHNFWEFAILKKQIDINYIKYVILPPSEDYTKYNIYNEEEIQNIWNTPPSQIRNLLLIYLYTGLRKTELLNILKEDIHLIEKYMIGGMKTKAGKNRLIPIHDRILPLIEEFYNSCNIYLIEKSNFKYKANYIRKAINDFNISIGNNTHTIHDTRRTFITRLNNFGANISDIAKIVGHSTGIITLDIYTLKDKEQLIKTVNLLP